MNGTCIFGVCKNRLNWSDLFEPVIELCRNGFEMTEHTGNCVYVFTVLICVHGSVCVRERERESVCVCGVCVCVCVCVCV